MAHCVALTSSFPAKPVWQRAVGKVQTGSHTDAIPLAGAYDGTLGVIGGIAALRALQAAGFRPRRGIEVIMFTSEEPTRFALGCSGRFAAYPGCFQCAVDSLGGLPELGS